MGKFSFKEVRKLQGKISKEIQEYKETNSEAPINSTIIPKLFESLYKLDEPAWEEMIIKHKDIIQNN